jgi:glycosyltransferase involved in cell wall biosynthesis
VSDDAVKPRVAFFAETHIGHGAYQATLARAAEQCDDITPMWFLFKAGEPAGPLQRISSLNWSLSASIKARGILARMRPKPDALFFHTPVTALLSVSYIGDIPTVISTDATPENLDEMGSSYHHRVAPPAVEAIKLAIVRRPYRAARVVTLWSEWARESAIRRYGVDPAKAFVIAPGVDLEALAVAERIPGEATRFLFVGGDFERKGGALLRQALGSLDVPWHLDAVTRSPLNASPCVTHHDDLQPNSKALYALFRAADVFVLPTFGDASPVAIQEAMAASLPVIATSVGAIAEAVEHGTTGLIVPPGDVDRLRKALRWMAEHPGERAEMGRRGRDKASARFDAGVNARHVITMLRELAREQVSKVA